MNPASTRLQSLPQRLDRWITPVAQIATRLAFGQAFALTGWGKLHDLDRNVAFFRDLGIPAPAIQAPFVATLEFVGGLCLVLGLATRPMAALLACTMVVALLTADRQGLLDAFLLDATFANIAPVPFLVALLWLLAQGAGRLSVDHLIARRAAR